GAIGGVGYSLWLLWLSLFTVRALCPFCLAVDVVVFTVAWYITLYNIEKKNIVLPKSLQGAGMFVRRHHLDILVLWFLLVAAFILNHFWYYFGKHLPF
ncbi:MAG TPA: vitamin K epoxide reductase family protein, partial [Candidatus Saccharimonadales bacterium]